MRDAPKGEQLNQFLNRLLASFSPVELKLEDNNRGLSRSLSGSSYSATVSLRPREVRTADNVQLLVLR